ncbi:hypothetical protein L6R49_12710 [Myxococcota bacterium]|nr:hypothetical protein [Myxococcota bacterium]
MSKDQLVPLGYAPVYKNAKGALVVDTDGLRRGGRPERADGEDEDFDGDDDDFDGDDEDFDGDDEDFDGDEDEDFDGDDEDDLDDDSEDDEDDNTDDEEDIQMSDDDFGARRGRRGRSGRSGRGGGNGRGRDRDGGGREPLLRRNQDRDGDGERDGGFMKRRRDSREERNGQQWVGTIVGDTDTLSGAGNATVRVVLQHDFIADELNFTGSRSDAKVTSVMFGDRTIFNNAKGIAVGAFTSTTRGKGTIAGQYLRAGLTITIAGTLGGAGDFSVSIPGVKPLEC